MSPEEACAMCEEVAQAEEDAQAAVTDARKYLAQRVQEAKVARMLRGGLTKGALNVDMARNVSR
eukprot:1118453-Heterocapsa_arctica.AAC.1